MVLAIERSATNWAAASIRPTAPNGTATSGSSSAGPSPAATYSCHNLPSAGVTLPGTPAEALVFWLGGARDANGNFVGFSANPINPSTPPAGTGRIGPFFDFDRTRLGPAPATAAAASAATPGIGSTTRKTTSPRLPRTAAARSPPVCRPRGQRRPSPTRISRPSPPPYSRQLQQRDAVPGRRGHEGCDPPRQLGNIWVNPQSFQLLCPGLDGIYGATTDRLRRSTPTAPITARTRWTTSPTSPRAASWKSDMP